VLYAAETSGEGGLVAEAGQQRNLYKRLACARKQVFGTINPKLNEALVDRLAKTCPKASREMTFRE